MCRGADPILHSFSNAPARKEVLTPGTTHVAVGFLDLGNLCTAMQLWSADSGQPSAAEAASASSSNENSRTSSPEPLRWVGFDMSSYCVAKSTVVSKMLTLQADVDAILQVRAHGRKKNTSGSVCVHNLML